MGGLCSRLDTEQMTIVRRSVADLVLAHLIGSLGQSNSTEVSKLQLKKISRHIGPSKARSKPKSCKDVESKHLSKFIAMLQDQQANTQTFIEEKSPKWRENYTLFWENTSFSTGLTFTSIGQLSRCIDNSEDEEILNSMRRRIFLVMFFFIKEKIKKRIQNLIKKLPNGTTYQSLAISIVVDSTCESDVTQDERLRITEKTNRKMRIGERYAQLRDDMLLKLGRLPAALIEKCTQNEYNMIREYLTTTPRSEAHSALVVDLKNAFLGADTIEDAQLDTIIESGELRLDQLHAERPRMPEMSSKNALLSFTGQGSPTDGRMEIESSREQSEGSTCQTEAIKENIAIMAEVCRLESALGAHCFKGMDASYRRSQEKDTRVLRFTNAVRLHAACREGEDFKLEVWLSRPIGLISQTMMTSVEGLIDVLGDYLFRAMKSSNCWKEHERDGIQDLTSVFNLSFENGKDENDCRLQVTLGYEMGLKFFQSVYP
ncbi:hypothetical protein BHYA_0417g00080 [Botrytis hyacinthi]|uniref:Uncharacterized protein n=1 Tax=Botrytis hyacinthi TaxID=278943 RepID=A0A4Z1GC17_9HELO|nr:hypothetical protein BHYA_0417g00080 [Botrytis hyacinthi]